jgi:hypothetical protein
MSVEVPRPGSDSYWTHDRALGTVSFFGPVRIKARLCAPERYWEPAEINWFHRGEGERTHVFLRPYVMMPTRLLERHTTRRIAPDPELDQVFGPTPHSAGREIERVIGSVSATYYPALRGLLLWEFHLLAPFRPSDPAQDSTYHKLWRGMEETLLELLPDARFLVTPRWDPEYADDSYERFLVAMGYLPHLMDEQLFMKSLPDP